MSNGNTERPPAQAPRGQSSANRVEVSAEGRQSVPTANAQGQEGTNGQSKQLRDEQLATTRAGAAATRTGGPGGARPAGSPSTPPIQQKHQAAQQTPQRQTPSQPTQQRQGPPTASQPQQGQSSPAQPRPQPQAGGQVANASAQTQLRPESPLPATPGARPAPGAVPVWDPPPPPGPKESLWTRLGFGRKAERPEANVAAPPAQQPRVPPSSRRQPHPRG